tara:strand:- start:439 stop:612 length:174 start_codon:yes stop_codon:yes gene_type:complete
MDVTCYVDDSQVDCETWGEESNNKEEQFHEWLNNCPVNVLNYEDKTDTVTITFSITD